MTEVGLDLALGASSSANVLITPTALGVPNLSSPLASFTLTTTQTLVTPYVLPTPVAITIGTQYAIVVGCGSLTDFVLWFGDAANSYAGGQTYVTPDGANWFGPVGGNADFAFQTWVAGPPPPAVPTNANACKKGGWQTLVRSNRTGFKNQGDCIQYVNTGK